MFTKMLDAGLDDGAYARNRCLSSVVDGCLADSSCLDDDFVGGAFIVEHADASDGAVGGVMIEMDRALGDSCDSGKAFVAWGSISLGHRIGGNDAYEYGDESDSECICQCACGHGETFPALIKTRENQRRCWAACQEPRCVHKPVGIGQDPARRLPNAGDDRTLRVWIENCGIFFARMAIRYGYADLDHTRGFDCGNDRGGDFDLVEGGRSVG